MTGVGGWNKLVCGWTGMASRAEEDDDVDLCDWMLGYSGRGSGRGRSSGEDGSLLGAKGSKQSLEGKSSDKCPEKDHQRRI